MKNQKKRKKKISGKTLQLKFMQRKRQAQAAREERKRRQQQMNDDHWVVPSSTTATPSDSSAPLICIKDDTLGRECFTSEALFESGQQVRGRRSFGRFNSSLEPTAEAAQHSGSESDDGISDQEMSDRFRKYVSKKK